MFVVFVIETYLYVFCNKNIYFRYDPYDKKFTREYYDHTQMQMLRQSAILKAKTASKFGVIMGTLGRQGSSKVVDYLEKRLNQNGKAAVVMLMSEIFPDKLQLFDGIEAFVQIACPRLSIDWGGAFKKPLLNPYELSVVLEDTKWLSKDDSYPMDFYANESLGPWTPNFRCDKGIPKNSDSCCGKCKN